MFNTSKTVKKLKQTSYTGSQ